MSEKTITVVRAGLQTTVQDRGRFGWEALGIPRGGAMDYVAYFWANRLAENSQGLAALEVTLLGPSLFVQEETWIATTGAASLTVDGCRYPSWTGFWVPAGATVALEKTSGARAYIAIHGGIDVSPILGSRSTDLSSGFGGWNGRALEDGVELRVGDAEPVQHSRDTHVRHPFPPPQENMLDIRMVLGPRNELFTPESLAVFLHSTFVVTPQSNRMGLRLQGQPLVGPPGGSNISEPMPVGAIQIPPDGQPIVLLNDRGTVGGYPVLGTVIESDVWRLGQAAPSAQIRFHLVSVRAGQSLTRIALSRLRSAYPVFHVPQSGDEGLDSGQAQTSASVYRIEASSAGIFYRGSRPGGPPLVHIGSAVQPDTVIGFLEIMKTFDSVVAGVAGRVTEIHVEDGDVVSEGQVIMTVDPTDMAEEE